MEHNKSTVNVKQINKSEELDVFRDVVQSHLFEGMDSCVEGPSKNAFDLATHVVVKVTFVASPSNIFVQSLVSQHLLKE